MSAVVVAANITVKTGFYESVTRKFYWSHSQGWTPNKADADVFSQPPRRLPGVCLGNGSPFLEPA